MLERQLQQQDDDDEDREPDGIYHSASTAETSSVDSSSLGEGGGGISSNNNNNSSSGATTTTTSTTKTTAVQSFIHLLKGYVGPGSLSLPWAFTQLGIIGGTIGCFIMAYWSSYNCWTVVKLKRLMDNTNSSDRRGHGHGATYPDVSKWLLGSKMYKLTTVSIIVQQLAICTVFLSFIGDNLQAVLNSVFEVNINHITVITMALPAVMALSFLPNLRALAPVTAAGTALLMLGLSLLAVVIVIEWPNRAEANSSSSSSNNNNETNWKQVPLAYCALLYSYEGICLILPVESSMIRPRKFFKVFTTAMTSSATIFAVVAVSCVTAFGQVSDGSITAFLLEKYENDSSIQGWLFSANAAVSMSVLVTYPLQLFPCLELLGPLFATGCRCRRRRLRGGRSSADFTSLSPIEQDDNDDAAAARSGGVGGNGTTANNCEAIGSSNSILNVVSDNDDNNNNNNNEGDDHGTVIVPLSTDTNNNIDSSGGGDNNDDDNDIDYDEGDDIMAQPSPPSTGTPQMRITLVLLTYMIAVVVPNVQVLISLAGALAGSSNALLIPPILEMAWLRQKRRQNRNNNSIDIGDYVDTTWHLVKCKVLLGLGLVFAGVGTLASIADIIHAYAP